jgi:trehalose 6-phosphate phosphatase
MIPCTNAAILQKIIQAQRLWFFLDYDGTLADFAPTPEDIIPDKDLIALIEELASLPDIRVTIISGRRLSHIQSLIPVPGILMAGTYGLELCTPEGETIYRLDYDTVRPLLDKLKENWRLLLAGRNGFFLEDKRWTLAVHAKDAAEEEAHIVLSRARQQADSLLDEAPSDLFRLQGGHRFLECGPRAADKKRTVQHILSTYPWADDALLVYLGDDDKDEVAFEAIREQGGVVVAVGDRLRHSAASCWLPSPQAVRQWLQTVVETGKETG